MLFRYILFPTLIFLFLVAGCSDSPNPVATSTTAALLPVTSPPSATSTHPAPADTPLPPPTQPTAVPVQGVTSTQINVRAEPSTAGSVLGILPANTTVEITGKDPAGNWWQILYPQGNDGKGWVTAQYVTAVDGSAVAVIASGMGPNSASMAVVQQQINVRSGPGTGFSSLGTLNARDVVNLTGKDPNSAWLQIEYAAGPAGKGWVNAAFVQAEGLESLPIVSEAGVSIGTGTPTGIPFTPTPTVLPARADNDSQNDPIAFVVFEPQGTHTLIYSDDVSSPEGDPSDWIQFTSYKSIVRGSLDCGDVDQLQVSFLENGQPTSLQLGCGDRGKNLPVQAGAVYVVQLQAPQSSGGLQYIPYTITIQSSP